MNKNQIRMICMAIRVFFNEGSWEAGIGSLFKSKYKMKLNSIEVCKLPLEKWDPNYRIDFKIVANKISRKITVIEGNYTIMPGTPSMSYNLRGYELQKNGAKNLVLKLDNLTCTNAVVYEAMKLCGFQMTPDCVPKSGTYTMPSVNYEDFAFMMTTTALSGAGRYGYDFESFSKNGFLSCVSMTCDLVANSKNN